MIERKPLIAGNWKMNMNINDSTEIINIIANGIVDYDRVDVLVAPPFTLIPHVKQSIGNSRILLGAQNMHSEISGAYTGEISGPMIKESGCSHVILGHSERRSLFKETSYEINLKVSAAVKLGIIPILCVGESLDQREAGQTFEALKDQLDVSLKNLRDMKNPDISTIIAYEPVWAIGTGKTAAPEQAEEVHQFIRKWIEKNFDSVTARQVRILYGGSVKPGNVSELMSKPDIDGVLVGGASLKGDTFVQIIRYS